MTPNARAEHECARGFTTMITGRRGKPSEVLLDLVVEEDGAVRGVANPGRQNAPIRRGHFDAISGVVNLEGEHVRPDGTTLPFRIVGRLDGRTLRLTYQYRRHAGQDRCGTFILFAELSNPTLGFYDRMGGERLLDDRGQFGGAYGWRDVRTLIR